MYSIHFYGFIVFMKDRINNRYGNNFDKKELNKKRLINKQAVYNFPLNGGVSE